MVDHDVSGARSLAAARRLPWVFACALVLLGTGIAHARATAFEVRYRSEETVYLAGGAKAGLAVGDRLEVWRDQSRIAEIEVAFVAGYSASCRVIDEFEEIISGDRARRQLTTDTMSPGSVSAVAAAPQSSEASYSAPRTTPRRTTRVSGTVNVDWESFSDDGDAGLDYDRVSARLSLRGRDLGGVPLALRVRARTQEIDRSRRLSGGVPETETRDRLYDVSLHYQGPNDRFNLMGGRLGSNPFVGFGFLDGVLAEVRAYKSFSVGGFWGTRPDVTELGFESSGQKYGAYTRFESRGQGPGRYDVVLAGIREEGDIDVSREYVLLETYYDTGGVWSFFERAEVDLNNDWREALADSSSQLSNLALSARARISDRTRLTLSYDRFEQYRTEETRSIPEELFDDLLRQGFRVGLSVGRPRELGWSVTAGWREQEGDTDPSLSLGLGLRHGDLGPGLRFSVDLLGYSNEYTEGGVVRIRTSKPFAAGHDVYLDLGSRLSQNTILAGSDDLVDSWARLGFWFELPAGLFARGELEYAAGDSLEGNRISAGFGYRF